MKFLLTRICLKKNTSGAQPTLQNRGPLLKDIGHCHDRRFCRNLVKTAQIFNKEPLFKQEIAVREPGGK